MFFFKKLKWIKIVSHSLLLFSGWLALSGLYDLFHIFLGLGSVLAVIFLNRASYIQDGRKIRFFPLRLIFFHLWMGWQMLLSALFVARCVLTPKLFIQPHFVRFQSPQPNPLAKVILANSITLTPGTLSVDVEKNQFIVHALSNETAQNLLEGTMPRFVASIFTQLPGKMVSGAEVVGSPTKEE